MFEPVFSPFGFAVRLERARHELVMLLDSVLLHLDTTFAATRALKIVAEAPDLVHAGEIGRSMGVSRQAAAVLVKRHLAARRLRVIDEGWARSVAITPQGREHLSSCLETIDGAVGGLSSIPGLRFDELDELLDRMTRALQGRADPAWFLDD